MTISSSETATDDDFGVVAFVTRLHAAAAAGLKLLEAIEYDEATLYAASDEVRAAVHAGRDAYDRLAEIEQGQQ